jgi:hypothetical protein
MARWIALSTFVVAIVTVGLRDGQRAADATGLGGVCESTYGCQRGTRCIERDGVMPGQCSTSCSDDTACAGHYGGSVLCLGADLCARACDEANECPEGTTCNAYGWCERPMRAE